MLLPRESANRLLTPAIQRYVFSRDWPKGLQIRLIERPLWIQFILFRDNFLSFDGEDMKQIAMMVKETMEKIRADGIPIYMEVQETMERTNGE